jgi:hypothetical protein
MALTRRTRNPSHLMLLISCFKNSGVPMKPSKRNARFWITIQSYSKPSTEAKEKNPRTSSILLQMKMPLTLYREGLTGSETLSMPP